MSLVFTTELTRRLLSFHRDWGRVFLTSMLTFQRDGAQVPQKDISWVVKLAKGGEEEDWHLLQRGGGKIHSCQVCKSILKGNGGHGLLEET